MESNWRLNVAKYGMVGSNWRLAARLLPPFDHLTLIGFTDGPAGDWYVVFTVPIPDPLLYVVAGSGNGPGHFPHGFLVEPD